MTEAVAMTARPLAAARSTVPVPPRWPYPELLRIATGPKPLAGGRPRPAPPRSR